MLQIQPRWAVRARRSGDFSVGAIDHLIESAVGRDVTQVVNQVENRFDMRDPGGHTFSA
jgi:hypothetical protein